MTTLGWLSLGAAAILTGLNAWLWVEIPALIAAYEHESKRERRQRPELYADLPESDIRTLDPYAPRRWFLRNTRRWLIPGYLVLVTIAALVAGLSGYAIPVGVLCFGFVNLVTAYTHLSTVQRWRLRDQTATWILEELGKAGVGATLEVRCVDIHPMTKPDDWSGHDAIELLRADHLVEIADPSIGNLFPLFRLVPVRLTPVGRAYLDACESLGRRPLVRTL